MAKKLERLDAAFAVARHLTRPRVHCFVQHLQHELAAGFDGKDTAGFLDKDGKAAADAGFEHTETFHAGFEKAAADADFEDKEDAGFEDKATFHEGFDNEDRAGFLDKGFEKAANAGFGGKETFTEVQGFYDAAADFEKDKAGDDDDGDDGGGMEGWEEGEEEGWEEGEEEETTTEEEMDVGSLTEEVARCVARAATFK